MVYLIIVVALLVIIAPIMAILPSRDQKARMEKRKTAMSKGIGVDLVKLEDPDPDREKYLSGTGKPLERKLSVAAYRVQRSKPASWQQLARFRWSAQRFPMKSLQPISNGWFASFESEGSFPNDIKEFLEAKLGEFATDVVKVEEINYILTVYWHEQSDVAQIIDFLKGCAELSLLPNGVQE